MDTASRTPSNIRFGRFEVQPHRRELLADGRPVKIGGRAFDVLMALIDAPGVIVDKNALLQRVWPNRVVGENYLQVQMSALRAALGADRRLIRTVAGRGYQFAGEIQIPSPTGEPLLAAPLSAALPVANAQKPALSPTNLPESLSELIGRDDALREIQSLMAAHRLVTLTGAGGIGKTRLAVAVARRLMPQFLDGVWLADLAPLADQRLVPVVVAAAMRLELTGGAVSPQRVADAVQGRRVLLILDNCEHVIESAAQVAEALLQAEPAMHIIATSRELLRAQGEWVYQVPPLAVPPAEAEGMDVLQYGAIRLFVERARAAEPHFATNGRVAGTIAGVCRHLDGIPLAIELVAGHAAMLGVEALLASFDDRFQLLTGGRRTALPRHRTLRATIDWSFDLLAEPERAILRRLSVFAGEFTLEAVSAVATSTELGPSEVVNGISNLITKSLVAAEVEDNVTRYRLLETMRTYALEKLSESGEHEGLRRRHAKYYRHLFERAEAEWETRIAAEWLSTYARQIDNVRIALDWAFSPGGDAELAIATTTAAVPLWMHLSLMEECGERVAQALTALATEAIQDPRRAMKLHAAQATALTYTKGDIPEIKAAWAKTLEIARSLDDAEYQSRSLRGLCLFHNLGGRYRSALPLAEELCALAETRTDLKDRLVGAWILGALQHFLGDHASARRHIDRVLAHHVPSVQASHIIRFQVDRQVAARTCLARILWTQGYPDQAMRVAESAVEEAQATHHALSLCYSLALGACMITRLTGDLEPAERYAAMLVDYSKRHSLGLWNGQGRCFEALLVSRRGDVGRGLQLLQANLNEFSTARTSPRTVEILCEMAEAFGRAGQIAQGLATVEEAMRSEELWRVPDLLRIKGELLLLQGERRAAETAENYFRQALDWARRQHALSWELRVATSLARLLRDGGRSVEARAVLPPVYGRFTEGFETSDLKAARALIDVLQ